MLAQFLLFIMGASGITIIISASLLFKPFREFFNKKNKIMQFFYKLLNCGMCTGIYIGVGMIFLHDHNPEVYKYVSYAGATSLASWAMMRSLN